MLAFHFLSMSKLKFWGKYTYYTANNGSLTLAQLCVTLGHASKIISILLSKLSNCHNTDAYSCVGWKIWSMLHANK